VTINVEFGSSSSMQQQQTSSVGGAASQSAQASTLSASNSFSRQASSFSNRGVATSTSSSAAPQNPNNVNINSASNQNNNLMTKSTHSTMSDFESQANLAANLSLNINSNTSNATQTLFSSLISTAASLKRTFVMALVHARLKTITFYCFTSTCGEISSSAASAAANNNFDQIKQLIDQACEQAIQRYHLANNAVLFKYGGLIGDAPIFDFKKVKTLTLSASAADLCQMQLQQFYHHHPNQNQHSFNYNYYLLNNHNHNHQQQHLRQHQHLYSLASSGLGASLNTTTSTNNNNEMFEQSSQANKTSPQTTTAPHWSSTKLQLNRYSPPTIAQHSIAAASPCLNAQSATSSIASPNLINSSIVANLQFTSAASPAQHLSPSPATPSSASAAAASVSASTSQPQQLIQFKQLYMNQSSLKAYDSVVNIVNHQVYFCNQYLGVGGAGSAFQSAGPISSALSASSANQLQQQLQFQQTNELISSISSASLTSATGVVQSRHYHHSGASGAAAYRTSMNNPAASASLHHLSGAAAAAAASAASGAGSSSGASAFYGVGIGYHLYELQQIYRHPKKIYELAVNLATAQQQQQQNQQQQQQHSAATTVGGNSSRLASSQLMKAAGLVAPNSSTQIGVSSLASQQQQNQSLSSSSSSSSNIMTVNEFYKNSILPVLIPFHYCCTPLLFYQNWHERVVSESMLRSCNIGVVKPSHAAAAAAATRTQSTPLQQQPSAIKPQFGAIGAKMSSPLAAVKSNQQQPTNLASTTQQQQQQQSMLMSNEAWYQNMRQMFLIEYSKFFESKGFVRLKDVERGATTTTTTTISSSGFSNSEQTAAAKLSENLHFIKWIQQDGFIYLTINLEEIYLHAKLGYCTRYRTANMARSFLNEMVRFFSQEFHVYSFTYDYHLSVINRNLTSSSWKARSQISQIISKFLDEFVDYYSRLPLHSTNKVYKLVNEKADSSLLLNQQQQQQQQQQNSHKYGFIFDYISAKHKSSNPSLVFMPLIINDLDNNIAIYSLTDSANNVVSLSQSTSVNNKQTITSFFGLFLPFHKTFINLKMLIAFFHKLDYSIQLFI